MKGIRLARGADGAVPRLESIAASVASRVTDCYWLASECLWRSEAGGNVADDAWFDHVVVARNGHRRLFRRGSLETIAPFIDNDWCHLFGTTQLVDLDAIDSSRDFLETHVQAYFCCVDGVRWEVFSPDADILEALRRKWPDAELIDLPEDALFG